jgi:hypothetical protein
VFVPGSLMSREARSVALADKSVVTATEMGHVLLEFDDAFLRLTSVLLAEQFGYNPTSVGCLADKGCTSSFTDSCVTPMEESTNFVLGVCARDPESALYQLPSPVSRTSTAVDVSLAAVDASVWRCRLAHLNQRDLAAAHEFVDDIPPIGTDDCRSRDASHVQHLLVRRSTRISWSHFPPRFKIATGTLSRLWTTIHDTCLPG